jgi:hypothetical protein
MNASEYQGTIGALVCWTLTGTTTPERMAQECESVNRPEWAEAIKPPKPASTFGAICREQNKAIDRTSRVVVLGPHNDGEYVSYSFAIGRKGDRVDGAAEHGGALHFRLADREIYETPDPNAGAEAAAMFARCRNRVIDRYAELVGAIDWNKARDFITRTMLQAHAVPTTSGVYFLPNDPGAANPVKVGEDLRDVIQAALPGSKMYVLPVFPVGDSARFSREAAEAAMLSRIHDVEQRLASMTFTQQDQPGHWMAEIDALQAQAELYERVLSARVDSLASARESARQLVKRRTEELVKSLTESGKKIRRDLF